ncbi:hypothetical protein LCGC14_1256420 [marine sediment metagenome]|uniref:Uncharacterized protein n=1 Tax=marine sediment metagenome TaxID=412755 RepID=A0A0F9LN84_9ZZZZ
MTRFVIELQERVKGRLRKIPNSGNIYMYKTRAEALDAALEYAKRIGEDDRPGLTPIILSPRSGT